MQPRSAGGRVRDHAVSRAIRKPLGGEMLLERAGIDPTARPEQLTVAQFAALANALRD